MFRELFLCDGICKELQEFLWKCNKPNSNSLTDLAQNPFPLKMPQVYMWVLGGELLLPQGTTEAASGSPIQQQYPKIVAQAASRAAV